MLSPYVKKFSLTAPLIWRPWLLHNFKLNLKSSLISTSIWHWCGGYEKWGKKNVRNFFLSASRNKNVRNCRNNQNIWQKGVKLSICCKIRKPSVKSPHKESNIYGGCPLFLVLQECDKGQIFYWSIQTCSRIMRLFVDCLLSPCSKNLKTALFQTFSTWHPNTFCPYCLILK